MRSFRHWTPRYVFDRISQAIHERCHPTEPWITCTMVSILESWLRSSDVGIEFGSGRSTAWFASRMARLTSVEHDPAWHSRVSEGLRTLGLQDRVRYLLRPLDADPASISGYVGALGEIPRSSLDFCLVDGVLRDECAVGAIDRLRPGAILVIDNCNWYLPRDVPSRAPNSRGRKDGFASELWREFAERTSDWRAVWTTNGVTDTAMFVKPIAGNDVIPLSEPAHK